MSGPLHQATWQRFEQPVLSAMTTRQTWCTVQLYNPSVIYHDGRFRMWYTGNASRTRVPDHDLGYADSTDGIHFTPHEGNPVSRGADLPFGVGWQTPNVHYDRDMGCYRMWFIAADGEFDATGRCVKPLQRLAYAESDDGLAWRIHTEPLLTNVRGPSVVKDAPDAYRMWICSATNEDDDFNTMVSTIYRCTSTDGLDWKRDARPCVTVDEQHHSVVYPFVMRDSAGDDAPYVMFHGCHVAQGHFELFAATSADGLTWTPHREASCFPASRDPNRFDGRYTSTPSLVEHDGKVYLYFSTRDLGRLYGGGDGLLRYDASGIYRHIGVAVCEP